MIRRPPRSTRTDTLLPYTTLFRSNWTATIARGWKRSARRSDRVFRHAGLVPASNPPRAIALEARWTPEPVRGDGMSSGFLPLARRREPHLGKIGRAHV